MKSHSAGLGLLGAVALRQRWLSWGGGRCLLAAQPTAEGPGLESRVEVLSGWWEHGEAGVRRDGN